MISWYVFCFKYHTRQCGGINLTPGDTNMSKSNLTFEKSRVQLIKPVGKSVKPSLTNVAVCSGCHGCTGVPVDSYTTTNPATDNMKIGW